MRVHVLAREIQHTLTLPAMRGIFKLELSLPEDYSTRWQHPR